MHPIFDVYRVITWTKLNPRPFDDPDDAILFAMSLCTTDLLCVDGNGLGRMYVRNGDVERIVPPLDLSKPMRSRIVSLADRRRGLTGPKPTE